MNFLSLILLTISIGLIFTGCSTNSIGENNNQTQTITIEKEEISNVEQEIKKVEITILSDTVKVDSFEEELFTVTFEVENKVSNTLLVRAQLEGLSSGSEINEIIKPTQSKDFEMELGLESFGNTIEEFSLSIDIYDCSTFSRDDTLKSKCSEEVFYAEDGSILFTNSYFFDNEPIKRFNTTFSNS